MRLFCSFLQVVPEGYQEEGEEGEEGEEEPAA